MNSSSQYVLIFASVFGFAIPFRNYVEKRPCGADTLIAFGIRKILQFLRGREQIEILLLKDCFFISYRKCPSVMNYICNQILFKTVLSCIFFLCHMHSCSRQIFFYLSVSESYCPIGSTLIEPFNAVTSWPPRQQFVSIKSSLLIFALGSWERRRGRAINAVTKLQYYVILLT